MPYTQEGAAVQTGGFGQIAPSVVNPNDAFDLLQKAFKTGLLQASEINNALNVIPAQQQGEIAKAGDAVGQAESNARMRPILERQKTAEGELQNRKLQNDIDDPMGLRQYSAKELLQIGGTPTGNVAEDMKQLTKLTQEKLLRAKKIEAATTLQNELTKNGSKHQINLDGNIDEELAKAREEYSVSTEKKKQLEADEKLRVKLEAEASQQGIPYSEVLKMPTAQLADRVATGNAEETRRKETGNAKPSEGQQKTSVFVKEIQTVRPVIDALEKKGYQPSVKDKLVEGYVPGFLQSAFNSEDAQQWQAAKEKWIEAVLRERSGAAIAKTEYGNADKQYFPQPNDTQNVVIQKRSLRAAAEEALKATFENGGKGIFYGANGAAAEVNLPAAAPSPATPAVPSAGVLVRRNPTTGELFYFRPVPGDPTKGIRTDPAGNPL